MKEAEMVKIAEFIERAIDVAEDDTALAAIAEEVKTFTRDFPMPQFK
jgi:glycine hydroxymethyltransferase